MTGFVALLRAVNVGGRTLKMDDLRRLANDCGLIDPTTHIASGNLLFASDRSPGSVAKLLEDALARHLGTRVQVMVRTAAEMAKVAQANPFPAEPGNHVVAIFLDRPASAEMIAAATAMSDERLALGTREIYVHYPHGQGRSKLRLPAMATGTARNMNTVTRLAELAKEKE